MSEFQPVADIDRTRVKAMHDQSRLPRLWEMIPRVTVFPRDTSKNVSGYRLDKLSDPLVDVSLDYWYKGEDPGASSKINEGTVTLPVLEGFKSKIRQRAQNRSFESRFAYFERMAPEQLDEIHRMFDLRVASLLTNTSYFSTETWSGTGALDTMASDHTPALDINNKLRSVGIRTLQAQMGSTVKPVCIMDAEVARTLQGYTVYSGRGSTSGEPQWQSYDMFRSAFGETHGIAPEDVLIYEGVYNNAREGQTASRTRIHNGVLWIGLLDRRPSFDLTTGDDAEGPDGGLAMAVAYEPELNSWTNDGAMMEYYMAFGQASGFAPRYSADTIETGIFFPASENFT